MAINGFRIGRLAIYVNKIARGNNGENPSWRGYCWGSDWPRASFSRQASCYCLDLSWLCYFASIYWNSHAHRHGRSGGGNG